MRILATFVIATVFGAMVTVIPVQANAQAAGVRVGTLECTQTGKKVNFLIHSKTHLRCTFTNHAGTEQYQGETGVAFGIDMQVEQTKDFVFVIVASTTDYRIGSYALEGTHMGAKGSAAAGIGVGANVLIGGGDKSFTLQPVSIESSTGFGAAAGLGYLSLKRM